MPSNFGESGSWFELRCQSDYLNTGHSSVSIWISTIHMWHAIWSQELCTLSSVFKLWLEKQTITWHLNSEQVKVHYSDISVIHRGNGTFDSPLTPFSREEEASKNHHLFSLTGYNNFLAKEVLAFKLPPNKPVQKYSSVFPVNLFIYVKRPSL